MKRYQLENCRDKCGFLDMQSLYAVCKKTALFASNAVCLYELEDCSVIFKRYSQNGPCVSAFNEVLYYRVLKRLGLCSAEYDFASYGAESGTASYLLDGNYKTLYELLSRHTGASFDEMNETRFSFLYLCDFFAVNYQNHAEQLRDELLGLIVVDALLGHADKSCTNLLLWESESGSEAHLCSVDASDLWGRFISLKHRGRELFSFLRSLSVAEQEKAAKIINGFEISGEIEALAQEYPSYSAIATVVRERARKTRDAVLRGDDGSSSSDYLLYAKREIRVHKGRKTE